eukprot:894837-Prorocentrum_minimum.AAC.1
MAAGLYTLSTYSWKTGVGSLRRATSTSTMVTLRPSLSATLASRHRTSITRLHPGCMNAIGTAEALTVATVVSSGGGPLTEEASARRARGAWGALRKASSASPPSRRATPSMTHAPAFGGGALLSDPGGSVEVSAVEGSADVGSSARKARRARGSSATKQKASRRPRRATEARRLRASGRYPPVPIATST